jgi:hypothetical protein
MEEIDVVKWWGAILATIAFAWNVINSLSNAPKLKVKLTPDMTYLDARVIKTETTEHGIHKKLATYCHIEITNIGKQPATITKIEATHEHKKGVRIFVTQQRFQSHTEENIPVFILPGQHWSCRLEMEDLRDLSNQGTPEIRVTASYKNKPIVVKPKITAKI